MRKLFLATILAAAALALPFRPAFAEGVDDLTLLTEAYPPFNFEEGGKLKGISVDLLDATLKKAGSKLTKENIKLVPWANGYKKAQDTKNTMLFAMTRTKERESLFKWVGPICPTRVVLTAKKDKKIKIATLDDAKKYKIGAIRDDVGEQLLVKGGIPQESLDITAQAESNVKKLGAGRIDMWSYEETVARWFLKGEGLNPGDYETVHVLTEGQLYFALQKDTSDAVVKKLQDALDAVKKKSGSKSEYQTIVDRYLK